MTEHIADIVIQKGRKDTFQIFVIRNRKSTTAPVIRITREELLKLKEQVMRINKECEDDEDSLADNVLVIEDYQFVNNVAIKQENRWVIDD